MRYDGANFSYKLVPAFNSDDDLQCRATFVVRVVLTPDDEPSEDIERLHAALTETVRRFCMGSGNPDYCSCDECRDGHA